MASPQSSLYRRKFFSAVGVAAASFGITTASFGRESSSGTIIRSDGGVNVRDFGARGDGKADDSKAIQAAVDAASGSVYFPKGIYRITKTIAVNLDKIGFTSITSDGAAQILMASPGAAFKFIGTHTKSADPKGFSENVWRMERMPMLHNISIQGEHPEAVGVEAVGTMQFTVNRLHVRKALHGIHLRGNNRNLMISDCHLYENTGIGIYYDDVNLHQSNITGCHISYNTGGGIVSKGGNVRNIHITGCDIESNMGREMSPTANVLIDCSSSAWGAAEVAITGCTIQHNSNSPDSANIRILGRSTSGTPLPPQGWGNVTITGNILSDVMVNVHLKDCRGVAIRGNTFWQAKDRNLLLDGCKNVVMGSNVLDFNPNYARSVSAKNGLRIVNCEDCTFTGLQITNVDDSPSLSFENCRRMNITGCNIVDSQKVGMSLRNVTDSIIANCIIRNSDSAAAFTAIEQVQCERNIIENNLV